MKRDICVNCRKAIWGKVIAVNTIEWKHILDYGQCDRAKPYPIDGRPCTCETFHYGCYVISCKCVRHEGQIN